MDTIEKIVVKKPRLTNRRFKKYQRSNLTNDFLFKHCFNDPEILRPLLQALWNKEIGDIVEISHDHRIQLNEEYRYVVCDMYVTKRSVSLINVLM